MHQGSVRPRLSIIIVSYNSQADLARCLSSIEAQGLEGLELVVVDNNPGDGTADWLSSNYPTILVISNPANTGYAGGNNLGVRHAKSDRVLLLNPDTELQAGALHTLLAVSDQYPNALLTPKLLKADGKVNACGNDMHYTGITSCRGLGEASEHYSGVFEVPLLSGAAILAPRTIFEALGGFDESYFMYFEDTDLSLRARLLGYRLLCAADAVVTHHYSLNMTAQKFYYLERNRLLTLLKIFTRTTWWRLLPAMLLTETSTWVYSVLKGPQYLAAHVRAYHWLKQQSWQQKRAQFQAQRQLDDSKIIETSLTTLPLAQLLPRQVPARIMSKLLSYSYQWLKPRFTPGVQQVSHG